MDKTSSRSSLSQKHQPITTTKSSSSSNIIKTLVVREAENEEFNNIVNNEEELNEGNSEFNKVVKNYYKQSTISSNNILTDDDFSPDRLTILNESNDQLETNQLGNSKRKIEDNLIGETILPTARSSGGNFKISTSSKSINWTPLDELVYNSKEAAINNNNYAGQSNNNQSLGEGSNPHLLFLGFISIIFLLIGSILYIFFYRRRRRTLGGARNEKAFFPLFWPLNLISLEPSKRKFFSNAKARKSLGQNIENEGTREAEKERDIGGCGGECIQLVESKLNAAENVTSRDDETGEIKLDQSEDTSSSSSGPMVVLRRKVAKNSFVVAATKRTRPRVELITTRVRKFIDDEAKELQTRGENDYLSSLRGSFLALISKLVPEKSQEEEEEASEQAKVLQETPIVEIHRLNSTEKIEMSALTEQYPAEVEEITADQGPKLSTPSPLVLESSMSGCSLFSQSPTNQQQNQQQASSSSCGCQSQAHEVSSQAQYVSGLGRSKSQNRSPNNLSQQLRPCCSASPTTQPNHYYYHAPHHSPYSAQKVSQACSAYEPFNNLSPSGQQQNGVGSNLKRHYENYYDDEHADAYRRLTESIGIELGLNFHHQPIASNNNHALNYATTTNDSPAAMNSLLHYSNCLNHAHIDAASGAFSQANSSLINQQHSICKCCQQSAATGEQSLMIDSYLLKNDCSSAGELFSSGSTSLGGSDSGFVNSISAVNRIPAQAVVCKNPLCLCQQAAPQPPMSILIQQPSVSTPPPQQQPQQPLDGEQAPKKDEAAKKIDVNLKSVHKSSACKARWKNRRHLSHKHSAGSAGFARSAPRRMSIAGDHVAALIKCSNLNTPSSELDQNQRPINELAMFNLQQPPLQHRASISSTEGCIWEPQQQQQSLYLSQLSHRFNHQNSLDYRHQHRPSDASSLYEPSSHFSITNFTGKSNCSSSSGGSSSGIGFSGSGTCTNTPTSAFPFGSSATKGQFGLLDFNHPNMMIPFSEQLNFHAKTYHHQDQSGQHLFNLQSGNGKQVAAKSSQLMNPACQSRKFSLPVHLESQAAECLSPNHQSRLLFEKNLQRVDSSTLSSRACLPGEAMRQTSINQSPPAKAHQQQQQHHHQQQQQQQSDKVNGESRRSSQTITRQSSFWLEDNSIDSILSLATSGLGGLQSEDGSQMDVNQLPCESDEARVEQEPQAVSRNSERPSLGSIVLSADSIESVKQKPPTTISNQHQPILSTSNSSENNKSSSNELTSASNQTSAASTMKARSKSSKPRSLAHIKNRLSNSSTSSTSSPSPDFSGARCGASDRILAYKSNSISKKRNLPLNNSERFKRLHSHRLASLPGNNQDSNSTHIRRLRNRQQHSAPSATPYRRHKDESEESDYERTEKAIIQHVVHEGVKSFEQSVEDQFLNTNIERISNLNSESLERQCRELWKLRATLHEDSLVADNWNNYHQRLNRRYDSGYRSIENQLSSSVEGNLLAAVNLQQHQQQQQNPTQEQTNQSSQLANTCDTKSIQPARPQSGCSSFLPVVETLSEDIQISPTFEVTKFDKFVTGTENKLDNSLSFIDKKFSDLDLDETALECLLAESGLDGRDCQSRNSKSSNEEEKKTRNENNNYS